MTTPGKPRAEGTALRRNRYRGSMVIGMLATFGVLISSGVVAVVVAGVLQWNPSMAKVLDNGIPLLVLFLGMVLCGRVAVDVAGDRALLSVVGTTAIVGILGMAVSKSSEAHGDGIEPGQVAIAATVVLAVVGASAFLVRRRRVRDQG